MNMRKFLFLLSWVALTIALSALITGCASFEGTKKMAENGNAKAQYELAQYYLDESSGVKRNPKIAFEWVSKAAKGGNIDAMFKLGKCFKDGTGTSIDKKEALKWLRKAAIDNSNSEAAIYLGKWICSDEENNDSYLAVKCLMVPIKKQDSSLGPNTAEILQENAIQLLQKVLKTGSSKKAKDFIRYFDEEVLYGRFAYYFLSGRKEEVLDEMHEYYKIACKKIEAKELARKKKEELTRKKKETMANIMTVPINELKALFLKLSEEKERIDNKEDSDDKKIKNFTKSLLKLYPERDMSQFREEHLKRFKEILKPIAQKDSLPGLNKKQLLEELKIVKSAIKKREEPARKKREELARKKLQAFQYPYADKYPFALKLTDKWSSGASYEWFLREDGYENCDSISVKEIIKTPKIFLFSTFAYYVKNKEKINFYGRKWVDVNKNDRIFIFGVPSVEDLGTALTGSKVKSKYQPILIGTSTIVKDIPIEKILKSLESKYDKFTKTTNKVSYLLMGSKCQVNANTSTWVYKGDKMYMVVNSNIISDANVIDLVDATLLEKWEKIKNKIKETQGEYSSSFQNCNRKFNSKDREAIARLINERKFGKLKQNNLILNRPRRRYETLQSYEFEIDESNLTQVIKLDYKMFKDFSNGLSRDINKYRKAKEFKENKKEDNILNKL